MVCWKTPGFQPHLSAVIDKGNKIKLLWKCYNVLLPNERPGEHCFLGVAIGTKK